MYVQEPRLLDDERKLELFIITPHRIIYTTYNHKQTSVHERHNAVRHTMSH